MITPLNIAGIGAFSSLGVGAAFNAAAMRCGYNGFITSDTFEVENEALMVAKAPLDSAIRGDQRLAHMLCSVVEEAMQSLPNNESVPLFICSSEQAWIEQEDRLSKKVFNLLATCSRFSQLDDVNSLSICHGRVSFAHAIHHARRVLAEEGFKHALILSAESLLLPQTINYYESMGRLLSHDNPAGFVPGEAAIAILVTELEDGSPINQNVSTQILGLGFGEENGTIEGDTPLTGQGLSQAVTACAEASGVSVSDSHFRLSTASGEAYFFKELSIALGRTIDTLKQEHPLWHPADHIGEVGAVGALAMVLMAHFAFIKDYAPGPIALCQLSNDDHQRAAFILRHTGEVP